MKIHFQDRRGAASLRYRNRAKITVLTCEQKHYPVFVSAQEQSGVEHSLRTCLHEGGVPQGGEVTCGGSPHLSCKRDQIKVRDYMARRVTPPPCKQALKLTEGLVKYNIS